MQNQDLIDQLDELSTAVAGLRQDLGKSADMPAPSMAPALVKAMQLNAAFEKLAKQARAGIAPLFGKNGDGADDADQGDGKTGRKPKK
ncbi:MAG TPA: hypothetical protein VMS17_19705 [Gemmataceae bacterium]|nr:hypothetical protein [Gemmataceae bacterium]